MSERREENADEYAARMARLRADLNYDAFYRQRGIWYRKRNDTPIESLFLSTQLEGEYQQRMTEASMSAGGGFKPPINDPFEPKPEHNVITHPKHYTNKVPPTDKHPKGIECYEVIMWFPTMVGSAIKYLWRAGDKDDELQDLRKAKQFIDFRIEQIEQQRKRATAPEPYRKEPA